jgi:peptide/nickel transport system permease protein
MLVPMFAIVFLSLSLVLIAQGFDRVFNPRVRARHAETIDTEDDFETSQDDSGSNKGVNV